MNGPNDKPEQSGDAGKPQPDPGATQAAPPADAARSAGPATGQGGTGQGFTGQGANAQGAAGAQASGPEAGPSVERLVAEVVKLEGQIKDLTDRLLRAHADLDNLRKRAEREKEETAKYAISKFAHDIVGVSDNFQRAISAVPAGAAEADPALNTLLEGVMMTEAELVKVMDRHGVKRIDPLGEPFSPHLHQAMMEQIDPSVTAGTILKVFQAGYLIDGRVIRPAMVVVAKGGAKPARPESKPGDAGPGSASSAAGGQPG